MGFQVLVGVLFTSSGTPESIRERDFESNFALSGIEANHGNHRDSLPYDVLRTRLSCSLHIYLLPNIALYKRWAVRIASLGSCDGPSPHGSYPSHDHAQSHSLGCAPDTNPFLDACAYLSVFLCCVWSRTEFHRCLEPLVKLLAVASMVVASGRRRGFSFSAGRIL